MNFKKGKKLIIYLKDSSKWNKKPLYEAIFSKTRSLNVAGATIHHGVEGFGIHGHLHKAHILALSEGLPIIITIIDTEEKINQVCTEIEPMLTEGLTTLEDIEIAILEK